MIVHQNQPPISIAWTNLQFDVNELHLSWRWRKKKTILQSMSGHCFAGSVTGLMGPSGSGKTTLLNILSGSTNPTAGQIFLGNHLANNSSVSYYIQQHIHESIVSELTVEQILRYAFAFKNNVENDSENAEEHIKKIMKTLMLPMELCTRRFDKCSGGEQKRISISQELMALSPPSFLFLDEPTTNLDSVSAFEVISCLTQLVKSSHQTMTIIASIHSPNGETLCLFDQLYVLSKNGYSIYSGAPNQIVLQLCDKIQFKENHPPIEVLLKEACQENNSSNVLKLASETLIKEKSIVEVNYSTIANQPSGFTCIRKTFCASDLITFLRRQFTITFCAQFQTLLFLPAFFLAFIFIVSNVMAFKGTKRSKCSMTINSSAVSNCTVEDPFQMYNPEMRNVFYTSLVLLFTGLLIITTTTVLHLKHLKIFKLEHRNYWYSVGVYFWSSTTVSLLELKLNVLLLSVLSYFLSGQHLDDEHFNWSRFALYILFMWLMCIYYHAIGQLVGSLLINHQLIAINASLLIYVTFTLFNGLYVRLHRTSHKYFEEIGNSIGMVYAIRGIHYAIFVFDRCKEEGEFSEVLIDFHIEEDKIYFYVFRILVNVFAVKMLTFLVLYIKFNDWKKIIPTNEDTEIEKELFILDSKCKNEITLQFNNLVVSDKTATQFNNKIAIAWKNLSLYSKNFMYSFESNKNKTSQKLLRNLNGQLNFGTLNAILGTSGAGKTMLLKVLNGQLKMKLSNETKIYLSKLTSIRTCFITQEVSDHLIKGFTGKQIVMYASRIKNASASVNHEQVADKWLQELDIFSTSNTPVERCSGGERKRLAIALEMVNVNLPNLICADEITSGLDSHSAEIVITTLKRVASAHSLTILVSIHQPTQAILDKFNQIFILARGGVSIYNGSPNDLGQFIHHQIPELLTANTDNTPIELLIRASCSPWPNYLTLKMKKLIEVPFNNSSANNELNKQTYLSLDGVMANRNRFTFHSVHQLSARYLQYIRAYLWKEWAAYLYICIVFATNLRLLFSTQMIYSSGCINFEADDLSSCAKTPQKVQNEMLIKDNFIYVYYCFVIYFILPLLYTAVSMYQEINVFRNEHRNGWYSAGAHFLMKIPFEMTPLVISNVVFVCIVNIYEPVVQSSIYFSFWFVLTLAQLGLVSMAQCITLLCRQNFSLAIIALSGTYVFTMVIGGAFVPFDEMPYIYKLLATFSIPRYTFQSAILLLFGFGRCQGQYVSSVLYSMNINDADYLSHIFMLLLNILIYRSLALYILIRCANPDENCKKRDA